MASNPGLKHDWHLSSVQDNVGSMGVRIECTRPHPYPNAHYLTVHYKLLLSYGLETDWAAAVARKEMYA